MKKTIIALVLYLLIANNIFGQLTKLSPGYGGDVITSLGLATSIPGAVALLEKAAELMVEEKNNSFLFSKGFSSPDTILELVGLEHNRRHPDDIRYVANLSKGLSLDTYRQLINETKALANKEHYIYNSVYEDLLRQILSMYGIGIRLYKMPEDQKEKYSAYFESPEFLLPKGREKEYIEFYNEVKLIFIENGILIGFNSETTEINDAMRQAGLEQLKNPKWPPQYVKQYMNDKSDLWDPALIDTTGIPEKYYDDLYTKKLLCPPPAVDSLCRKYVSRINRFQRYDQIAKEQGISPHQALYNEVKNDFYKQGYKPIHYIIDYAIKNNDEMILIALKEFLRAYPDYEIPSKSRKHYEQVYQFVLDNR